MKAHFRFIDSLYVLAMLLVVLGHIGLTPSFATSFLHEWIFAFHMPLFFWIAGFLLETGSNGIIGGGNF